MGVVNHNAIIATTWSKERADAIHVWISGLTEQQQKLFVNSEGLVNQYQTFALMPDGSKEGWDASDAGDDLRELFIARLTEDNYEDGSSPWAWVEVGYGEFGQTVIRGNNQNCYDDRPYYAATNLATTPASTGGKP